MTLRQNLNKIEQLTQRKMNSKKQNIVKRNYRGRISNSKTRSTVQLGQTMTSFGGKKGVGNLDDEHPNSPYYADVGFHVSIKSKS